MKAHRLPAAVLLRAEVLETSTANRQNPSLLELDADDLGLFARGWSRPARCAADAPAPGARSQDVDTGSAPEKIAGI